MFSIPPPQTNPIPFVVDFSLVVPLLLAIQRIVQPYKVKSSSFMFYVFASPVFFPQLFVAFFHFFKKTFPTPPPPTSALPSTAGDSNTIVPHQFITRHKPGDICLKPTFFGFFALSIHNWDSC